MPVDENALATLGDAARLSSAQLESICQSVLGGSVSLFSNASLPAEQARDIGRYAKQYGLLRELAAAIIMTGSDRAGLQNLLLGDENMEVGGKQQDNTYIMLRIENKLDNISMRIDSFEQRLRTIEAAQSVKAPPVSVSDRIIFVMVSLALLAMLAYNVWGHML